MSELIKKMIQNNIIFKNDIDSDLFENGNKISIDHDVLNSLPDIKGELVRLIVNKIKYLRVDAIIGVNDKDSMISSILANHLDLPLGTIFLKEDRTLKKSFDASVMLKKPKNIILFMMSIQESSIEKYRELTSMFPQETTLKYMPLLEFENAAVQQFLIEEARYYDPIIKWDKKLETMINLED